MSNQKATYVLRQAQTDKAFGQLAIYAESVNEEEDAKSKREGRHRQLTARTTPHNDARAEKCLASNR